jgi:hypothetical protein
MRNEVRALAVTAQPQGTAVIERMLSGQNLSPDELSLALDTARRVRAQAEKIENVIREKVPQEGLALSDGKVLFMDSHEILRPLVALEVLTAEVGSTLARLACRPAWKASKESDKEHSIHVLAAAIVDGLSEERVAQLSRDTGTPAEIVRADIEEQRALFVARHRDQKRLRGGKLAKIRVADDLVCAIRDRDGVEFHSAGLTTAQPEKAQEKAQRKLAAPQRRW